MGRPPVASNVLIPGTLSDHSEAPHEFTDRPAVVIRFLAVAAGPDRGLARAPDQRRRPPARATTRPAHPAHRAVPPPPRRPPRPGAHPSVAAEHGPPAGLRHPRR